MGFFARFTGTKRPARGVPTQSPEDLRARLLGLNGPDIPYVVRDGSSEAVDLIAEWRLMEPAWQGVFRKRQLSRNLEIRMRFDPDRHEVRVLEQQWEITWVDDRPVAKKYGRGPGETWSREWIIGRKKTGGWEITETFRFDSSEMKNPLQNTVLAAGWVWRGVPLGKL
ncbi:hypothetical protein [Streptomyces spirodelae]|uniref:Nuclear transport factor 2 family protein n=1 Tax=Streptomyces spirodelae TaxID=2812904 RepID=A0ABS3X1N5_9ACTN|nr:hypothetical protein [Streptomyces spirodelae]MBO8189234.1 hypothetical protein [Streptomyces spirodelae]